MIFDPTHSMIPKVPESSVLSSLTPGKILLVAIMATATWLVLRWTRGFLDKLEKYNPRLRFFVRQVEPPIRILFWFLAILFSVEVLAPSKDAFLAALGSAALAIGLGLQDLIKNLIGGLVIIVDRPFQTGDRIRIADAYGEIRQIGLRSTRLYMSNGMLVTIPNSEILTKLIFNANAGVAESIVSAELALRPGVDADRAISVCREVAVCCPYTHLGREVKVKLHEDPGRRRTLIVTIQAYVYDHRYESAMKTELLRRARHEFQVQGLL